MLEDKVENNISLVLRYGGLPLAETAQPAGRHGRGNDSNLEGGSPHSKPKLKLIIKVRLLSMLKRIQVCRIIFESY
jgi:hypothetical protein